jgi:hypothetical protein
MGAICNTGHCLKGEVKVGFKIGCVAIYKVRTFSFAWKNLAVYALLFGGSVLVHAGQQVATIRHINISGDDHDLTVQITASSPVAPRTQTVTDPDRLIVDFPAARPDIRLQKIPVNRGRLKDVRVGLLSANPPTTRVVLDLTSPTEYQVSPLANTIVVKLGNEPAPAAQPTTSAPADTPSAETTAAVPNSVPPQSPEPSRLRWILPILVISTVMAMLVIAIVAHLQNKRSD